MSRAFAFCESLAKCRKLRYLWLQQKREELLRLSESINSLKKLIQSYKSFFFND
jgi:hypothetical protein